ncbi:hypothetical protein SAMN02745866_03476 [Alteromonadaceae bacterium Bs31]|nr:hypothetical protein SAMN02745866_03476 [Alteromonadaceae bacterium Bs31]
MAQTTLNKLTAEEQLVLLSLAATYPVYLLGGLYVLGSVLGWLLLCLFALKVYLLGKEKYPSNPLLNVSPVAWLWALGMLGMLVALLEAHIDRQLGFGTTIKSSLGWAKGWALMALFPILGCMISIRPEVITRGVCIASASALPFAAIGLLVYLAGLPGDIYLSPFKAIGGPHEVFVVRLFGINPETGMARWQFTGPWAPAAGLLSCFYLVMSLQEKNTRWRILGVSGAVCMCLLCQSRAGWAVFMAIIPIMICMSNLKNPLALFSAALLIPTLFLLGQPVIEWMYESYLQIKDSRPDSTRVRGTLARLALQRWENEAPVWGHGVVERGPKIVEYMPIGTHHTWYGLLFIKGVVGLFSLAIPLFFTCLVLLIYAQQSAIAKSALGICIIMISYSFFENLEILAYVFWPALLWIGISLRPRAASNTSSSRSCYE